jgi:hypothetical protein
MPLRFFYRIPIIGRFVTLNLSKGNVSASVGVPGFRITHGTAGSRVTVGIPGTGLFYTERINTALRQMQRAKDEKVRALAAAYLACAHASTVTADQILAALDQQRILGLADSALPPEVLDARAALLEVLQTRFGYRVVKHVQPPPAPLPAPSLAIPLTIVAVLVVIAGVATWWLS